MMARWNLVLFFCCFSWAFQVVTSQQCQPFTFISPSTVVQFGDQVLLNCSYGGGAAGGVSWTKDPQLSIGAGSSPCHCAVTYYNLGVSLFINVTDGGDLGSYTCAAQVSFQLACSATVQVLKAVPPVLTAVGSSSQTASQGSTVTFFVNLTTPGLPLASVVWTKNGVSLYNTTNMVVTSTMLQLSNIQPGDRGQYVATATNMAGSNSATFMLLESFFPVVNMSVTTLGSQAMILCEAYGYPALTDVTILGGTSTSNIFPRDNFTSWGRASSTQPLMGCPTTFQCKATNGFGATTIQTMACSGLSAVTGVMVTSTTGYANLWWIAVPNANGYRVYVNQTTTATSSITNVTTGVMVTIPISCGQPYTFGVQAYNDWGFSDVSPLVQLNSSSASCAPFQREYALAAITVLLIPVVVVVMLIFVWRRITSRNASREMRNFVDRNSTSNCQPTPDIPLHSNVVYTSFHGTQPSSTGVYDVIGTAAIQPDYDDQYV